MVWGSKTNSIKGGGLNESFQNAKAVVLEPISTGRYLSLTAEQDRIGSRYGPSNRERDDLEFGVWIVER
jgi:hypothetical protein